MGIGRVDTWSTMTRRSPYDWPTMRRVAVLADCDPRTVDRFLRGTNGHGPVRSRIMAALLDAGLVPPASAPCNAPSRETPEEPERP
jgi:hypothetical protein